MGIFGYVGIPSFEGTINRAISGGIRGLSIPSARPSHRPSVIERPVSDDREQRGADDPARLLFDAATNTDWQGTDKVPSITVTFKGKVDLGAVVLPSDRPRLRRSRRPAKLTFTFPDGSTQKIALEDISDFADLDLSASNVDTVVMTITATNGPETAPISISRSSLKKS